MDCGEPEARLVAAHPECPASLTQPCEYVVSSRQPRAVTIADNKVIASVHETSALAEQQPRRPSGHPNSGVPAQHGCLISQAGTSAPVMSTQPVLISGTRRDICNVLSDRRPSASRAMQQSMCRRSGCMKEEGVRCPDVLHLTPCRRWWFAVFSVCFFCLLSCMSKQPRPWPRQPTVTAALFARSAARLRPPSDYTHSHAPQNRSIQGRPSVQLKIYEMQEHRGCSKQGASRHSRHS